ncbi:hypothetical protein F1188_04300 [Roseospira marina]|uniref:Uncharacterized protein n=1 Tax=Roseospira marina TaxID=140057 RepID=A0A5M6IHS4_9PROT|nr:hypothetical protein [Roseospira marina]KAA5607128.1 hypothetical protein F1188_04300 [Roseospira marina]MBB4312672.1 hypothetical protein [Roseospira marina]MBB5086555.1 hypothetical protein [Roseospira marina]
MAEHVLAETVGTVANERDITPIPDLAWASGVVLGWHRRAVVDRLGHAATTLQGVRKQPGFCA